LLTVVVVYWLGRAVASSKIGLWAAGIICFYPSLLVSNNLLLTETLFTFLLASACCLIVVARQRQSLLAIVFAGAVLGLAALTRSVVWLAPPFLAIFVAMTWPGGWAKRSLAAATFIVTFALTIAPWAVRNSQLQKTFVAIDVMGGRNFMMGNYRHTPLYRSWDAISLEGEKSWAHEVFTNYPQEQRTTQGQVDKLALRQGLAFVKENPSLTAQRSVVKFFDFWGLEREIIAGAGKGLFGSISRLALIGLTAVVISAYVLTLFLGIYGFFCVPPNDRIGRWLLVCVIVFVCGMHTIVFGHSRYHLPLMPLVAIFAACAIVRLGEVWRQRGTWKFIGATAMCGIFVCGWVWSFVVVDWERFVSAWNLAV
jgi:4-amino-4-deoxy-L-arabinose transferase-like glycosyltransferase